MILLVDVVATLAAGIAEDESAKGTERDTGVSRCSRWREAICRWFLDVVEVLGLLLAAPLAAPLAA